VQGKWRFGWFARRRIRERLYCYGVPELLRVELTEMHREDSLAAVRVEAALGLNRKYIVRWRRTEGQLHKDSVVDVVQAENQISEDDVRVIEGEDVGSDLVHMDYRRGLPHLLRAPDCYLHHRRRKQTLVLLLMAVERYTVGVW